MRRGTTPTYDITISDMKNVEDVCLAFEQTSSGVMLAKHVSDNDGRSGFTSTGCYFTLSQEETAMFSKGSVKRQIKLKFKDDTVSSTDYVTARVYDEIHEEHW